MDLFSNYPTIRYSFDPNSNVEITLTNFFIRVKVREMLLNNSYVFYDYTVKANEKPEDIAFKYYGSTEYWWVINLANNIIDPLYDWVLPNEILDEVITKNFGSIGTAQNTIFAYLDQYGNQVDQIAYTGLPESQRSTISVYDWYQQQNEAKRNIKLLSKDYLGEVESNLNTILQDAISTV